MTSSEFQAFYSVRDAAKSFHIAPATLYRAIRKDAFPASQDPQSLHHSGQAIESMIEGVTTNGRCVDITAMMGRRGTNG